MSFPIRRLHRYPINPRELQAALQRSQDALAETQRSVADNLGPQAATKSFGAVDCFLAVIQGKGPNDEDDHAGATYWVKRSAPSPFADTAGKTGNAHFSTDGTGLDATEAIDDPQNSMGGRSSWFTACNLAELVPDWSDTGSSAGNGSHLLSPPAGSIVLVFGLPDPADPTRKWYVFSAQPLLKFIITGNSTRPGVYTANPLIGPNGVFTSAGTGAVTLSDVGSSGSSTVLLVNQYEMGKDPADPTQHDLASGQIFSGTYLCQDTSTPSKSVFLIEGINPGNCSG